MHTRICDSLMKVDLVSSYGMKSVVLTHRRLLTLNSQSPEVGTQMHYQLIPIGEVGIYKNAIHTSSEVCANTYMYASTDLNSFVGNSHACYKKYIKVLLISPLINHFWSHKHIVRYVAIVANALH